MAAAGTTVGMPGCVGLSRDRQQPDLHPSTVSSDWIESFFGGVHGSSYFELFDDVGASWARLDAEWAKIEPREDEFDFERWDRIADQAAENGIDVLPILLNAPEWASPPRTQTSEELRYYPPADDMVDAWRSFVERMVTRYPQFTYWEIWNEPNLDRFLTTEQPNYEVYVERILRPAAEVLHDNGRKVVAPAIDVSSWDGDVSARSDRLDRWLTYQDAYEHVDVTSIHYTKGDVDTPGAGYDGMMPIYDYLYRTFVDGGPVEGVWNTEEGLTMDGSGTLQPWEQSPYAQWVPRYTVPLLHWALVHGWTFEDQYKAFWYNIDHQGAQRILDNSRLLEKREGEVLPSARGEAMRTLVELLTSGDQVRAYPDEIRAEELTTEAELESYGFSIGEELLVVAWQGVRSPETGSDDSSGLKRPRITIDGFGTDGQVAADVIDYRSGDETRIPPAALTREPDADRLVVDACGCAPVVYVRVM